MANLSTIVRASLRVLIATSLLSVTAQIANAQCMAGPKHFASHKGGPSSIDLRIDPRSSGSLVPPSGSDPAHTRGLEYGRFWESNDAAFGNNFSPGDPDRKMAPAGCGLGEVCCASTDPARTPDGGWWQVSQTTRTAIWGFITGPGCRANTCPDGDMTYVVEDWGSAGPPGALDTAFFIAWRANHTPADLREWDLAKICGVADCEVPFREFPVPLVTGGSSAGTVTVRSNRDPGDNVYVFTPAEGLDSLVIENFDVMVHYGAADPGRDRNAMCGAERCWNLLQQIPYADAALPSTEIEVDCDQSGLQPFLSFGLSFVGGAGGSVPSQLVGWAIPVDCECADADGDGAGCGDCDDADPDKYPGAEEVCDDQDNDCDGSVDEDLPTWYHDADGDGFGNQTQPLKTCDPPPDYVASGADCDDADSDDFPGNVEDCDGQDNDCDNLVDDDDPDTVGQVTWYLDGDGDGFGNSTLPLESCEAPADYVANGGDCDDADPLNFPGNNEVCDGQDNDCDGDIDEGFAGNNEVCDGQDNDCDGDIDEGDACVALTADATGTLISDCVSPSGATMLLDGTGSSDPQNDIAMWEWFENFDSPSQVLLGEGETLEVTLPVAVHVITLRVTDATGNRDTDQFVAPFLLPCWQSIDPVVIVLARATGGTVVRWTEIEHADSYDVVRGNLSELQRAPDYISLGRVVCVADDTLVPSSEAWPDAQLPGPNEAFFYVVRQTGLTRGIYGIGSQVTPRIPVNGDCLP